MYTMNGTFGEVLAFLDGYANGKRLGNPVRSGSYFHPLGKWLAAMRGYAEDADIWATFINEHPDEATALREFARLYREYADTKPAFI
ncbi:MAG TPA: hypothetical protein VF779_02995 [Pyrinomonadaceae bacterium]